MVDADLRQAFADARILGVKAAALVYPQLDVTAPLVRRVLVADGSDVVIHLSQVTVAAPGWAGWMANW